MQTEVLRGADRLIRDLTEALPSILDPENAEGLFRLRAMARGEYEACGYYYGTAEVKLAMYCLDGFMVRGHRESMESTIHDTSPLDTPICGFWCIKASPDSSDDEYHSYSCCHYYMTL